MVFRVWRILLVLVLSVGVLGACSDDQADTDADLNTAPRTQNLSVDDIQRNPAVFYGQQMTVSGYVVDVLAPNLVLIASNRENVDGPFLLVLSSVPDVEFDAANELGDRIVATGDLRPFVREELEPEYVIPIAADQEAALAETPIIIAYAIGNPDSDSESGSDVTPTP